MVKIVNNISDKINDFSKNNNFTTNLNFNNILSSLSYSAIFLTNIEIEFLIIIAIIAGAYVIHNNPVLCLIIGTFLLTIISFQLNPYIVTTNIQIFVILTMCSLLTYVKPTIGFLTFLYPLGVIRDEILKYKFCDSWLFSEYKNDFI